MFKKLARTSLEIIEGFEPKYGWILDNPYAKVWVAANTLIGLCWEWSIDTNIPKSNPFIKEAVDNRVKISSKAVAKIQETAIGALPVAEEILSEDGRFINSEKVIWELAPCKRSTYVQVIHKFKQGSDKGWTEL